MLYDILPYPKPRMTQQDKWRGKPGRKPVRPAVSKYRAFCDECRLKMVGVDLDGADIVFYMPMPPSWSKKKRAEMLGEPHRQKPDLDNLIKALADALHSDDSHISDIRARKVWANKGHIMINGVL